jgi:hypothetical protein
VNTIILGALAPLRNAYSIRSRSLIPSFCAYGTTLEQPNGFSLNFIFGSFNKICRHQLKSDKNKGTLHKDIRQYAFLLMSRQFE